MLIHFKVLIAYILWTSGVGRSHDDKADSNIDNDATLPSSNACFVWVLGMSWSLSHEKVKYKTKIYIVKNRRQIITFRLFPIIKKHSQTIWKFYDRGLVSLYFLFNCQTKFHNKKTDKLVKFGNILTCKIITLVSLFYERFPLDTRKDLFWGLNPFTDNRKLFSIFYEGCVLISSKSENFP